MLRRSKALSLILVLGAATAAGAQTTSPAPAPLAPDTGTPVQDPNAPGTAYVQSTSGDWDIRCVHTKDGHDPCQLFQLLKDASGSPVAEFAIAALPPGQPAAAGATIVTPLETLLPRGILLQIDNLPSKAYGFLFCNREGCVANVGFTTEEIDAMRKGAKIAMTVIPVAAPNQPVDLTISLKGFSAGYDKVNEINAKNHAQPAVNEVPAAPAAPLKPTVPSIAPKK